MYKSPMVDFGYDVSDYRQIDPIFGTLDDFSKLVAEMRKRGANASVCFVQFLPLLVGTFSCRHETHNGFRAQPQQ